MTSNVLENLPNMVRKSSQNTSKIDLEGGLEAAWEPPLCGGDPKTPFLLILAPLWDPIWEPVLVHFGNRFLMFFWDVFWMSLLSIWGPFWTYFWGLFWYVFGSLFESLRKPWHARKHQYLLWFSHVGACGKLTFLVTFGIILGCFLGYLFWEGCRTTFCWFWTSFGVPFGDHFGHFGGTVFGSIFRGLPGLSKSQSRPKVEGD